MRYVIIPPGKDSELASFTGDKDEIVSWLMNKPNVKDYAIRIEGESTYLTVGQFLSNVVNVVAKYYQMDPETEDLLSNADCLANGMKVLVGDPDERGRPEEASEDWSRDRVLEANRWCTVTNLKLVGNNVSFIGVYDDGTKRRRSASRSRTTWLVKKESLKKSRIEDTQRYKDVYEIVKGALVANEEELGFGVDNVAKTATKKILGSIG